MNIYAITEGYTDILILQRLLPNHCRENTKFIAAQGLFRIKPLATSLILAEQKPVVLFIDADSSDLTFIDERRKNFEESLNSVSIDAPIKVIVSIPEIEAIFFEYSNILSRVVDVEISEEIIMESQKHPRVALKKLFDSCGKSMNLEKLLSLLSEADIQQMQEAKIIQDYIYFANNLEKMLQPQ